MARAHEVVLLGKKFKLKSAHDAEYLSKLAEFVAEKVGEVQKKGGAVSTLDAVLLAALNIADDYHRLKNEAEGRLSAIGEKTQSLLAALEEDAGAAEPPGDVEDPADDTDIKLDAGNR